MLNVESRMFRREQWMICRVVVVVKVSCSFALHFLRSKFNKEDAIMRMPNAANELTGKQQLPTATPAIAAVTRINFLLVYFTGIFLSDFSVVAGEFQIQQYTGRVIP